MLVGCGLMCSCQGMMSVGQRSDVYIAPPPTYQVPIILAKPPHPPHQRSMQPTHHTHVCFQNPSFGIRRERCGVIRRMCAAAAATGLSRRRLWLARRWEMRACAFASTSFFLSASIVVRVCTFLSQKQQSRWTLNEIRGVTLQQLWSLRSLLLFCRRRQQQRIVIGEKITFDFYIRGHFFIGRFPFL